MLITDLFDRADSGTLGANWTAVTNTQKIVSQQASSVTPNLGTEEMYSGANFAADQFAETTVGTLGHTATQLSLQGPCVRMDGSTAWYVAQVFKVDAGSNTTQITVFPSGTTLVSETATTWVSGDTIRLVVTGTGTNNLKCYRNGSTTPLLTASDAGLATGGLGQEIYVTGAELVTNSTIETWKGGDFTPPFPWSRQGGMAALIAQ